MNASEAPVYAPTWYTDTMMMAVSERKPLAGDCDVEVCIIGAGLAGLTTALELARRGFAVAVLEARRIAWNASGRNTGFVIPGFAQSIDVIVRRVGLDHAKALWALSEAGLEYVRSTIDSTHMPGVAKVEAGWLKVAKTDTAEEDMALVRLIGEEIGAAVEGWPTERVRAHLRTSRYFHAIHFPTAFHIHPLNYALGLAAAAERLGVRIFEATEGVAIDAEGVRKWVATPHGRVRAAQIVLAGNVHLRGVMPQLAATLLPVWTYVATTAPLTELDRAIDYPGAVSDTDLADNHYKIISADRLMWSGGMTTWKANPRRFVRRLRADIERVYPQLRPLEIEHIWTGVLGNPLHRMPQIGQLSPGLWLASGFGGHGLNTTAMAGNIIARAIHEGDDAWRLFAPFDLVWAGGPLGRAAAQAHYWWHRWRERTSARIARRREAERRRDAGRELVAPLEYEEEADASPRSADAELADVGTEAAESPRRGPQAKRQLAKRANPAE